MKVYFGADHGGFELKDRLEGYVSELGYETEDFGAHKLDPEDDYPDFVFLVAEKVARGEDAVGIVIGRSGNGEAIAANKVKGIRAAVCTNVEMARKAREDNDANILALGADYISEDEAGEIVKTFLETPFSSGERHKRRLQKVSDFEAS